MFLRGIKVLDLGSYVAGPAAATVMSDFGADVIKIEPLDGDPYRRLLGRAVEVYPNFFWDQDSRNKRSLAIDFTTDDGYALIGKLVRQSDVVVTNYRPELLARHRLTYDDLAALRSDVIYGQVNSYGLEGPDRDRTGFDATAWWARSGLMDHVRRPLGAHAISAPGMGDHATCMSLFGGIMAALYRREKTSEGAHVYTSLLANGAWSHSMLIQGGLVGFDLSDQATPDDLKATPLATMYETSDDRTLLLCILNPVKEWAGFIRALGSPAWASEPRFADPEQRVANAADLHGLLADLFRNDTANHWRERLDAQAITYSIASNISDVINDEQLYANDILTPMSEGPQLYAHIVNSPIWIKGVEKTQPVAAPDVGQHTDAVLSELGLSGAEIDALVRAGTVGRSA